MYLASGGWDVVGVDFVPAAIATAKQHALSAGCSASFVVGDVTQLRQHGVRGPFDLIMDIGCFHVLPAGLRGAYAVEVAAVARQGADFYLAGIWRAASWRLLGAQGVGAAELRRRFGGDFDLAEERAAGPMGRRYRFVLYHLVRK